MPREDHALRNVLSSAALVSTRSMKSSPRWAIGRDDDAFYALLRGLERDDAELYLGLVHAADGAAGTARRMAAASRHVADFGIATECGIDRGRVPGLVTDILRVHAAASA
jgi:hypothetical protein